MLNVRTRNFGFAACVALVACAAAAPAQAPIRSPNGATGVKIAAFPGGPQGGVFANNVYNGFKQAELDLGPTRHLLFLRLGPQQDADPDPAGAGDQGRRHRHLWLRRRGGDRARWSIRPSRRARSSPPSTPSLPESQKKYSAKGFGYVGAPNYSAGYALAAEAAKRARLKPGDKRFRLGPQGPGRRSRPAHRRRDRRLRARPAPNNLSGDRRGDQRRSERRHRDLRRRDGGQSRDQDRRHRPRRPDRRTSASTRGPRR